MNRSIFQSALCALGVAACGGTVTEVPASTPVSDGGAPDASDALAGDTQPADGATSEDAAPDGPLGCYISSPNPGPYSVAFRFHNNATTAATLYIRELCDPQFSVTSCGDGYVVALAISARCTDDCTKNNCIQCEACLPAALSIPPNGSITTHWDGYLYASGTNSLGCECHIASQAPAAHYRVSIPVYGSAQDAIANAVRFGATWDFDLTESGQQVDVYLVQY
jgi:hypothetical protein